MQENAAQRIRQKKIPGLHAPGPPLAKLRAYGARAERLRRSDL